MDVTKMPIIGQIKIAPIGGFKSEILDVVAIKKEGSNTYYILNSWYKEYKKVPQIVHSDMVEKYIPIEKNEGFKKYFNVK